MVVTTEMLNIASEWTRTSTLALRPSHFDPRVGVQQVYRLDIYFFYSFTQYVLVSTMIRTRIFIYVGTWTDPHSQVCIYLCICTYMDDNIKLIGSGKLARPGLQPVREESTWIDRVALSCAQRAPIHIISGCNTPPIRREYLHRPCRAVMRQLAPIHIISVVIPLPGKSVTRKQALHSQPHFEECGFYHRILPQHNIHFTTPCEDIHIITVAVYFSREYNT